MEVHVPKMVAVHEKLKRFSMARYSKIKGCYLLPAAPVVMDSLHLQFESSSITITSLLPKNYLDKRNLPNKKQLDLSKTKKSLLDLVPEQAQSYLSKITAINFCIAQTPECSVFREVNVILLWNLRLCIVNNLLRRQRCYQQVYRIRLIWNRV